MLLLRLLLTLSLACLAAASEARAQDVPHGVGAPARSTLRVAVLDFGDTETGRRTAADAWAHLSKQAGPRLGDPAPARPPPPRRRLAGRGRGDRGRLRRNRRARRGGRRPRGALGRLRPRRRGRPDAAADALPPGHARRARRPRPRAHALQFPPPAAPRPAAAGRRGRDET